MLPFAATWMDLETILSEVNQTNAKKISCYHLHVESLKKIYTNELIYKTETDSQTENKFMITKGENGGGINQEFWSNIYTLLLEEGMETHSSIPAWRIPMDRGAWQAIDHGVANSQT